MADDVNPHNSAVAFSKEDLRDAPYTNALLSHAHPEHLHATTARLFIGPIPQGWIKTNKRTWYGTKKNYTKRAITFTAPAGQSNTRSTSWLGSEAARETISSTSEQVISQTTSSVPTSLQFTSDSGTTNSGQIPKERRVSELDRVVTSPAIRFLSPKKQREEEDELDRLDEEREEREIEQGEVVDLEPVPSQDKLRQQARRAAGAGDIVTDSRISDEQRPLLRNLSTDTGGARDSYVESIVDT